MYNFRFLTRPLSLLVCVSLLTPIANANPESIVQIFQRLEILEKKSRELTGQNEVLKHQIDQMKKVQKQGFLNVDEQIDEMRQSMKAKVSTQVETTTTPETVTTAAVKNETATTTPATVTPKAPETKDEVPKDKDVTATDATTLPVVKTEDAISNPEKTEDTTQATDAKGESRAPSAYEKETYQAAFNKMSASPTAATRAFKEYIQLQPNSPLAANAQYWIGEIMYSHNNYKGAVQEFIKVLQKYKTSNKAPDAAIKLGYSFYALKNWTYARRTFEDVLKYFPDNKNAVNLATKRLEKMKAAGN